MLRWDKAPYTHNWIVDVPGLGRYLIKRLGKGSRTFRAYLNNKPTAYFGNEEQIKRAIERTVRQWEMTK